MSRCKNCNNIISGKYCANCGQKVAEERITLHFIWHGLVHFFTHAESGFFYTTGQMISKPGTVVANYINGIRIRYQAPVSFFLIWITAYILLLYLSSKVFGEGIAIDYAGYFGKGEKTKFAMSYLNIVLLALLPFQALFIWGILLYKRFNYFESFVAVLYSIGTVIFWQCVFVILAVIIHLLSGAALNIRYSDIFKAVYVAWVMIDFTKLLDVRYKLLRSVIVFIMIVITFTAWRLYIYPSVAGLFF